MSAASGPNDAGRSALIRAAGTAAASAAPAAAVDKTPLAHPKAAISSSLVLLLQRQLLVLGFDPGRPDGKLGPQTRAAIKAFREQHSLPVEDAISYALLEKMRAAEASKNAPTSRQ